MVKERGGSQGGGEGGGEGDGGGGGAEGERFRNKAMHLCRDLHITWDLLTATVAHVHCVGVERAVPMLSVPAAPINLEEQLPIGVERLEHIAEIDHLRRRRCRKA